MRDSHHERQSRHRFLPLVMKYSEFIGCGGWDGEIENQGHAGAILIDGCPLAKHLGNKKVNSPDGFACTLRRIIRRSVRRSVGPPEHLNVLYREFG